MTTDTNAASPGYEHGECAVCPRPAAFEVDLTTTEGIKFRLCNACDMVRMTVPEEARRIVDAVKAGEKLYGE